MKKYYDPSLITSEVCIRCGRCCKLTITPQYQKNTESQKRQKEFYELIFSTAEHTNVVADNKIVTTCPKLVVEGSIKWCSAYQNRPKICEDYNCFEAANKKGHTPEGYEEIMKIIEEVS